MKNQSSISDFLKSNKVRLFLVYAFFALISLFIYFNSLHNDFLYDDKFFIVRNLYIRDLRFIPRLFKMDIFHFAPYPSNYYRPIQMLTYLSDYLFWKLNPLGYHLTNVAIHSLNSFLVFLLVYLIFKDNLLALLSGILFCIHPINIGVVSVIGGRSNILEMMFMLLSLISLLYHYLYKQKSKYFLAIFLFILAILSREGALLLPFFIILCALALDIDKKKLLVSLLPFLIIWGLYLIWRTKFMPSDKLKFQVIFSWQSVSTFFYLAQSYLSQLILPHGLAIKMLSPGIIFGRILTPLSFIYILIASLLSISKNKIAIFGFAFYLLGLLPLFNLIGNISSFGKILSEPYVYMASVGFFILIAYLLLRLHFYFPKAAGIIITLIILFYSSLTVANNLSYKDEATFYNYLLSVDSRNTIAHLNLGNIYFQKKMFTRAEKEAGFVLTMEPDAWDAYLLLGNIFKEKGDLAKAGQFYNKALILNPSSSEAINNLGLIYKAQGQVDKASQAFKKAIAINPESLSAMQNLVDILIAKKLYNEGLRLGNKILQLNPGDLSARVKIGIILAESGHFKEAESVFRQALILDPNSVEAMRNLGVLYANTGDLDKAMSMWDRALTINPDDQETQKNIKQANAIKGGKNIKPR